MNRSEHEQAVADAHEEQLAGLVQERPHSRFLTAEGWSVRWTYAYPETIAQVIAAEFIPLYNDLTTSDLQGCVGATVSLFRLKADDAREAENLALELIYEAQEAAR